MQQCWSFYQHHQQRLLHDSVLWGAHLQTVLEKENCKRTKLNQFLHSYYVLQVLSGVKSIALTLLLLIVAYLAFLLPVVAVGWGLWTPWRATTISNKIKAVLASFYWWMYGVNFIIYLSTSYRIRKAYGRFLRDVLRTVSNKSGEVKENVESSIFWIGLRNLEQSSAIKCNE